MPRQVSLSPRPDVKAVKKPTSSGPRKIEMTFGLLENLALGLRGSGLAFALFLGLMHAAKLPCGPVGGCDAVLSSPYGNLLGVPLGFYASLLWLAALLVSHDRLRRLALALLALGSLTLLGLQAFVLRAFCPWCLAHAVFALLSYPGWRAKGHWSAVLAALLLAGGGHYMHRRVVASQVSETSGAVPFDELRTAGFEWLGRRNDDSPLLVLGLGCPSCWERWLRPLGSQTWSGRDGAPSLLWKVDPQTRGLTEYFVAVMLSQEGSPERNFARLLSSCAEQSELFLTAPEKALAFLRSRYPDAEGRLPEARALVARQTTLLQRAKAEYSPLYLQRGLPPVSNSSFEEDFARR